MNELNIEQWVYAACRMGQSGTSGYQTYTKSPGVTSQEEKELESITRFWASDDEAEPLVTHGFFRLASGRWGLFKSSQGARDDLGRPAYFAQAFLIPEIDTLPHPPFAYIGSPSFRRPLDDAAVRSTEVPELLDPVFPGQLLPFANFPADLRSWLKGEIENTRIESLEILSCFQSAGDRGILVAEEEPGILRVLGLLWEFDDEFREAPSFCTLLPSRNQTEFRVAGWPPSLGRPSDQYVSRFAKVVSWKRIDSGATPKEYERDYRKKLSRVRLRDWKALVEGEAPPPDPFPTLSGILEAWPDVDIDPNDRLKREWKDFSQNGSERSWWHRNHGKSGKPDGAMAKLAAFGWFHDLSGWQRVSRDFKGKALDEFERDCGRFLCATFELPVEEFAEGWQQRMEEGSTIGPRIGRHALDLVAKSSPPEGSWAWLPILGLFERYHDGNTLLGTERVGQGVQSAMVNPANLQSEVFRRLAVEWAKSLDEESRRQWQESLAGETEALSCCGFDLPEVESSDPDVAEDKPPESDEIRTGPEETAGREHEEIDPGLDQKVPLKAEGLREDEGQPDQEQHEQAEGREMQDPPPRGSSFPPRPSSNSKVPTLSSQSNQKQKGSKLGNGGLSVQKINLHGESSKRSGSSVDEGEPVANHPNGEHNPHHEEREARQAGPDSEDETEPIVNPSMENEGREHLDGEDAAKLEESTEAFQSVETDHRLADSEESQAHRDLNDECDERIEKYKSGGGSGTHGESFDDPPEQTSPPHSKSPRRWALLITGAIMGALLLALLQKLFMEPTSQGSGQIEVAENSEGPGAESEQIAGGAVTESSPGKTKTEVLKTKEKTPTVTKESVPMPGMGLGTAKKNSRSPADTEREKRAAQSSPTPDANTILAVGSDSTSTESDSSNIEREKPKPALDKLTLADFVKTDGGKAFTAARDEGRFDDAAKSLEGLKETSPKLFETLGNSLAEEKETQERAWERKQEAIEAAFSRIDGEKGLLKSGEFESAQNSLPEIQKQIEGFADFSKGVRDKIKTIEGEIKKKKAEAARMAAVAAEEEREKAEMAAAAVEEETATAEQVSAGGDQDEALKKEVEEMIGRLKTVKNSEELQVLKVSIEKNFVDHPILKDRLTVLANAQLRLLIGGYTEAAEWMSANSPVKYRDEKTLEGEVSKALHDLIKKEVGDKLYNEASTGRHDKLELTLQELGVKDSDQLIEIQKLLKRCNLPARIDGAPGRNTQNSILQFQSKYQFEPRNAVITEELKKRIEQVALEVQKGGD